jgi:hypothetical protein
MKILVCFFSLFSFEICSIVRKIDLTRVRMEEGNAVRNILTYLIIVAWATMTLSQSL